MRAVKTWVFAAVAVLLVLAAADSVLAQEDTIWIKDSHGRVEKLERVSVGRETHRFIRYKIAGAVRSWEDEPTENVVRIEHGNKPMNYALADRERHNGNWPGAVDKYKASIKHDRGSDWVKKYARFFLAECYRMWGQTEPGKLNDAVKAYDDYLKEKENSDHRFVPNAYYGKALAARAANKIGEAKAAYDKLGKGPYGETWEIYGQFGSAQLTGGSAAIKIYERIIEKAKRKRMYNIVAAVRLSLAKTLVKEGKLKEAIKMYKEIASTPEGVGKEVLAAVHNGLGSCYEKLASGPDDYKRALFAYLKVVVLYSSAHSEYLHALKKSRALLEKIGGEVNKERAEDLRKEYEKALKQ